MTGQRDSTRRWAIVSALLVAGLLVAVPAGAQTEPAQVTMVVGDAAAPSTGDAAVQARLEGLGYTVSLVDDNGVGITAADGASLVMISSSVSSSAVGDTFRSASQPVWVAKPWSLDDMAMTGPAAGTDYGTIQSATVAVVEPAHPLAAGLSGDVTVTPSARRISFGEPGTGATAVTTAAGETSTFVYAAGATLTDGSSAAGCRIHASAFGTTPTAFTAEGWQLFDSAAAYGVAGCDTTQPQPPSGPFVILVSVDGLRPDTVLALGPTELPALYRFIDEGAGTSNARTVFDSTRTLPNHVSMVTGLPVLGPDGHYVTFNEDNGATVHAGAVRYVPSMFDVAHDAGLSTALFAGKDKFDFIDRSWDAANGAPDVTGADDGTDKIDHYERSGGDAITASFTSLMTSSPFNVAMVHYAAPDTAGHDFGWESPEYEDALREIDGFVATILALVETDPMLAEKTHIVLTTDHGGTGITHGDSSQLLNATIPFFVWGPETSPATDLYAINPETRADPGTTRPDHAAVPQPVRNADAGNLVLDLLELPPIPGSVINASQDLAVAGTSPPPPPPPPDDPKVLMVVSSPAGLTSGDGAVHDHLVDAGYEVTLLDDNDATGTEAAAVDFVFVASSVSSSALGDTFAATATPVWVAKPWLLDDMAMTGTSPNDDFGTTRTAALTVSDPAHPLAAGFTNDVTITSSARTVSFGVPALDADVVLTANGLPATFVYHSGDGLADGTTAVGCRMHASVFTTTVLSWTSDAWALFDAAAAYAAAGCTPQP